MNIHTSDTESTGRKARSGSRVGLALRLGFSLLLLAYVLQCVDWSELRAHGQEIDLTFLALFIAITPVNVAISVLKWQQLLTVRGIRVSFGHLFSLYVQGQFYNSFLPSSVGGDVVRALRLTQEVGSPKVVLGSVVVERFTGLTVLVGMTVVALLWSAPLRENLLVLALSAGCVVAYLAILIALLDARAIALLKRMLIRVTFLEGILNKLERFQESLMQYRTCRGALFQSLLLSLLFYVGTILNVYLACRMLGRDVPLSFSLTVPVVLLISILPVTINGMGLTEWAFMATFPLVGISPTTGLSVSVLIRVKLIVWSSFGYLVHLLATAGGMAKGNPAQMRPRAETEPPDGCR